jgi:hypothetical protein
MAIYIGYQRDLAEADCVLAFEESQDIFPSDVVSSL